MNAPDYEEIRAFVSRLPLRWVLMICDTTSQEGREAFVNARSWHGSKGNAIRDADAYMAAREPGWVTVADKVARGLVSDVEAFDKANAAVSGRGRLVMTVSAKVAYECVKGQ